jgi:glycosyltransferase involved in cell wall biosynthesis
VGNIAHQEGLDILIEAAEILRKRGRNDIHFTCVGRGPGLAELRTMCTAKKLDDMFNFTGRIPDKDLLEILSTADVCVNPDTPCEMNDISTMIKIMEYMALGKPIVQFDLKEGRFSAGEGAVYADPTKLAEGFADKIAHLLDHPEERKQRGEFGQKRVETELAWEYSIPHLVAAYKKALGGGPTTSGR